MSTFHDEEWRDIPGFGGMYQASTLGRVRSTRSKSQWSRWKGYGGSVLKPAGKRYRQVTLQTEGGEKSFLVHRLVAITFLGEPPEGMQVCHCDGDRHNNRLDNLRFDTVAGNHADKVRHGTSQVGHRHPRAKFSAEVERSIATEAGTVSSVARKYGVCRGTVRSIRVRHGWRKCANGRWQCRVEDVS